MKTYGTYSELETELFNDNQVQNFTGLTQTEKDNVYTMNVKTIYGMKLMKVRVLEEI